MTGGEEEPVLTRWSPHYHRDTTSCSHCLLCEISEFISTVTRETSSGQSWKSGSETDFLISSYSPVSSHQTTWNWVICSVLVSTSMYSDRRFQLTSNTVDILLWTESGLQETLSSWKWRYEWHPPHSPAVGSASAPTITSLQNDSGIHSATTLIATVKLASQKTHLKQKHNRTLFLWALLIPLWRGYSK